MVTPQSKSIHVSAAIAVLGLALVMMLVSTALASVGPRSGTFDGNAGAFSVGFTVSRDGKQITGLRTDFQATEDCGPASVTQVHVVFPSISVRDGDFSGSTQTAGEIPMHYSIRGSFHTPTAATGTIRVHFTFPHNALPPCNESDSFSVKRVSG